MRNVRTDIFLIDSSRNEVASFELCHVIKSNVHWMKNPVIIFSDNTDESVEVAAFRAGADDYLRKPVKPIALVERIKARVNEPKDVITVQQETDGGQIYIDRRSYTVYAGNKALNLSRKEFELLYLLASQPGKIFRREEVFAKIWNKKFEESNRTVDVHILRLRKKLGQHSIYTQKGVGYRFKI
jgi:two-component system alkaline phosphatase synthesis response regulator PhoP